MTIAEFGGFLGNKPLLVFLFFGFIILFAILAGIMGKGEGHLSPWKYLYSALIYLTCIPAILIVTISVFALFFEKDVSLADTNLVTQVVPVISMIATLMISKSNVSLDRIPGFGKISGLILMIIASSVLITFVGKMRFHVFSYMPIQQVGIMFLVIFAIIYFGWRRMMSSST